MLVRATAVLWRYCSNIVIVESEFPSCRTRVQSSVIDRWDTQAERPPETPQTHRPVGARRGRSRRARCEYRNSEVSSVQLEGRAPSPSVARDLRSDGLREHRSWRYRGTGAGGAETMRAGIGSAPHEDAEVPVVFHLETTRRDRLTSSRVQDALPRLHVSRP
jgi:hypothetical protein